MERDDYLDGIRGAWLGEQFGEVFFNALAERATDNNLQAKWHVLARLEQVTGNRMAELLATHGEVASTDEAIEVGEDMVNQYANAPHLDAMRRMKDVVEKAIVRFDQLLALAPEPDVEAVQFLVDHEQALLTFVERELAGDGARSLEAAETLLAS